MDESAVFFKELYLFISFQKSIFLALFIKEKKQKNMICSAARLLFKDTIVLLWLNKIRPWWQQCWEKKRYV